MSFNNISGVEHAHWQHEIRKCNVEKGWYDRSHSFVEGMGLLMTEVCEISDAWFAEGLTGGWEAPEQMQSEFADVYIRLCDDSSRFGVDLGKVVEVYKSMYEQTHLSASFDADMMFLMKRVRDVIEAFRTHGLDSVSGFVTSGEVHKRIAFLFLQLQETADYYGVNLMKAVEAKVAKNWERPYRHGNKFA
jgi:NTP pyrophosphatase (non-canonical NTP hydrolase)